MRKYLDVHVYGHCGTPCPGKTEEDCLKHLARFYTFLLVFETNICQHYLSPHLLRALHLKSNALVPVVFGGVNYNELFSNSKVHSISEKVKNSKQLRHTKGDSFLYTKSSGNTHKDSERLNTHGGPDILLVIDALGHSPRALANYLKHLVNYEVAGIKDKVDLFDYLQWREEYELKLKEWPCILCEKLRNSQTKVQNNVVRRNIYLEKSLSSELCTNWPTLNFGGGNR